MRIASPSHRASPLADAILRPGSTAGTTEPDPGRPRLYTPRRPPGPLMGDADAGERDRRPATASAAAMEDKGKAKRDGVVKEVIRLERESVIPILKPKLVMRLAYLIGARPLHCRSCQSLLTFCCTSLALA